MSYFEVIFWLSAACVFYTCLGFPLALGVRARLRPRPVRRGPFQGRVSLILAMRNEEATAERRISELTRHLENLGLPHEFIVVSDGSTDETASILQDFENRGLIRLLELSESAGKAAALSLACEEATGDILVFADARQTWADDALIRLLENFADPTIGAVSGDLVLESAPGVLAGIGTYWRLEKWMRRCESLVHSQVGVTGAIAAVRRPLLRPIPPGTLLDDVFWPLCVAMGGCRVVHDERAMAFDRLPVSPRDEFRRKVRTLAGSFQLAARLPESLLPWRNPVWTAWISHKLARLVVPWALIAMLATSALLGGWYFWALSAQAAGYAMGLLGLVPWRRAPKLFATAGSFLVLNAAAWLGFWVWALGRTERTWTKARYLKQEAAEPVSP